MSIYTSSKPADSPSFGLRCLIVEDYNPLHVPSSHTDTPPGRLHPAHHTLSKQSSGMHPLSNQPVWASREGPLSPLA